MNESWTPWTHYSDGLPEPGDYIRLKCGCIGTYREGIYLGTTSEGALKMAPSKGRGVFCYWSRRDFGDLSEQDHEKEEELI